MSTPGGFGFPHEVLTAVLEHLPPWQLRTVSQVSRDFYRAAHDAGLTMPCNVHTDESDRLDRFADIVAHAETRPHLFKLELGLAVCRRTEVSNSLSLPPWDDIWTTVRRAMPFIVSLHVCLHSDVMQAVLAALDTPAPHLRMFSIDTYKDRLCLSVQPAASLFGGSAPRLRRVALEGPALLPTGAPVPAWAGVRVLRLVSSVPGQPVDVGRFFPALRELNIIVFKSRNDETHVVDLGGLNLDMFVVVKDVGTPVEYTALPASVGVRVEFKPTLGYDAFLLGDGVKPILRLSLRTCVCNSVCPSRAAPLRARLRQANVDLDSVASSPLLHAGRKIEMKRETEPTMWDALFEGE